MQRPSGKELFKKIKEAHAAILAGKYQFDVSKHLVGDLEQLGVDNETQLMGLVLQGLREIIEAGPEDCWRGGRPPARSYEPAIHHLELWAFAWDSVAFGRKMYLKFALKRDVYYYVDCHVDRPPKT